MATYTTNYNLKKPAQEDFIDVADLNANFDALDTQLKAVADTAEEQAGQRRRPQNPSRRTRPCWPPAGRATQRPIRTMRRLTSWA